MKFEALIHNLFSIWQFWHLENMKYEQIANPERITERDHFKRELLEVTNIF